MAVCRLKFSRMLLAEHSFWRTGVSRFVVAQKARAVLWERSSPWSAGWGGRTLYPQRPALSPPTTPDHAPADGLCDAHARAGVPVTHTHRPPQVVVPRNDPFPASLTYNRYRTYAQKGIMIIIIWKPNKYDILYLFTCRCVHISVLYIRWKDFDAYHDDSYFHEIGHVEGCTLTQRCGREPCFGCIYIGLTLFYFRYASLLYL